MQNIFFGWTFRWSVSYQFTKNWQNPHLKNSKIIKNPKNRFLADPFVIIIKINILYMSKIMIIKLKREKFQLMILILKVTQKLE